MEPRLKLTAPEKKCIKVHQNRRWSAIRTNVPYHDKFHRARPNDVREKRYIFYTFQYFGASWRPPAPKFTNLSDDVQQGPQYQAADIQRLILPNPNALFTVSKGMRAVNLCSSKSSTC